MNKNIITIIYIVLGVLIIVLLSFILYKQFEISNRQTDLQFQIIEQKELSNGVTRSENKYVTVDDLEKLLKAHSINQKTIIDDLNKFNAELKSINVVSVQSKEQIKKELISTSTGALNPQPVDKDPYNILNKQQIIKIDENFSNSQIPIGSVGFSAWKVAPWELNILPRTYNVITVEGIDENQRSYYYNKFTINVENKEYEVKIDSAKTIQKYPEAKFSWFNPKIFLGADGGLNLNSIRAALGPNINISVLSYGQYKKMPDICILQLGVGYELVTETPEIIITPIAYNIGKHLPLIDNTYLAPSLHMNFDKNFLIMLGVRVAL